jgi:hypothetical protein
MSTSSIRRGRDERNGEGANLDEEGQYIAHQSAMPDSVDESGRPHDQLDVESTSLDEVEGGGVAEGNTDAEVSADQMEPNVPEGNVDAESSADNVEGGGVAEDEESE